MEKEQLSEQDAFARLRKASQVVGPPAEGGRRGRRRDARRMSEHPNATRARGAVERFAQGDVPALLDLFADDAIWHGPRLDGAQRGRTRAGMRSSPFCVGRPSARAGRTASAPLVVADDGHLAAGTAPAESDRTGELDVEQALLVELEGGRWKVVRAMPLDQAAFDAFWNDQFDRAAWRACPNRATLPICPS